MRQLTYQEYCSKLTQKGYRVKENLAFLDTPTGVWISKIVQDLQGFGLTTILAPGDMQTVTYSLTEQGRRNVNQYIRELKSKRKEILDAGIDTAEETNLPTQKEIEEDINFIGIDADGEYVNGWGVTDNYDADSPILLKIGRDFDAVRIGG